jgi:hypothetical protein
MCDRTKSLQLSIKATYAVYSPNEIVCQPKLKKEEEEKKKEWSMYPFEENTFCRLTFSRTQGFYTEFLLNF